MCPLKRAGRKSNGTVKKSSKVEIIIKKRKGITEKKKQRDHEIFKYPSRARENSLEANPNVILEDQNTKRGK